MPDKKGQNLADLIYGQDSIRPTEVKRPAALGLGQALQKGHEFVSKPFGYPNPPAEAISEFLGVPAIARTLERLGYGEPLTTGKGMTTKPKEDTVEALLSVAPLAPATKGMPVGAVIKPKGGNWLTGSVEKSLAPLRSTTIAGETPAQRIPKHEQLLQDPSLSAESRAAVERHLNEEKQRAAIDNWVDRNLANYVKKEMATPEDPVRKLAEQGITHLPIQDILAWQYTTTRKKAGFPKEGMGQSEAAKNWENISDAAFNLRKPRELISPEHMGDVVPGMRESVAEKNLAQNPWLAKVDPETTIYWANTYKLGFDHIIDVLREDLATGRIRPEQLSKVSMEQAVRRTYEYDQELAKKMAEATAAARTGLPVYKEYPEKYRWIELNRPGAFASESEAMGHSVRGYEPPKGHPDWSPASGDSGSPSYGHGGWEAIKSGRAKVYSLVDEKGQPHVTVEVERKPMTWDSVTEEIGTREAEKLWKEFDELGGYYQDNADEAFDKFISSKGITSPARITQIKGKQNRAPKEEYLPFVQDFVKSGQWSDVGDITNANLEKANWTIKPQEVEQLKSMGIDVPDYVTPDERLNLIRKVRGKSPEDMKHGGSVHISNNPDTMRLELAAGGGVDRVTPQDMLYLTSHPDFAKMSAQQQREAVVNMGDRELSERLKGKMAEGGAAFGAYTTGKKYQQARQRAQESGASEVVEGALRGILGLEPQEDAGARGMDAYRNLQAVSNSPTPFALAALPAGVIKSLKASEALGKFEGRPLLITQADRSKVGGKWLGGPGFSGLQHERPEYKAAEATWGVNAPQVASTILGGYERAKSQYKAEPIVTTMLGTPTQHQSNKMVFEELHRLFKNSAKQGNLTPELHQSINDRLRAAVDKKGDPVFPSDVDILSPNFRKIADTFDRRAIASSVMGGTGVGGKKGQIIDYDAVIRHTTDPALLEAPTGALGNRLFTLSGGVIEDPKLHPAFPHILQGEDVGLTFNPVERELVMRDFIEQVKREKGREPGYMDYTRGYPPSQLITDKLLTELQKAGKKKGGAIKKAPGGEVTIPDMTDGGKVIDGGPFKKGGKVQFTDNLDTMRLAVGRK